MILLSKKYPHQILLAWKFDKILNNTMIWHKFFLLVCEPNNFLLMAFWRGHRSIKFITQSNRLKPRHKRGKNFVTMVIPYQIYYNSMRIFLLYLLSYISSIFIMISILSHWFLIFNWIITNLTWCHCRNENLLYV